jgi:hypothetical protein
VRRIGRSVAIVSACLLAFGGLASAEELRGLVVDQSSLAVPGATVELRRGDTVVSATTSGADGSFTLDAPAGTAGSVVVSLSGFETVTVARDAAARVVLKVAGATDSAEVTASGSDSGAGGGSLGSGLSGAALRRLPSARQHVRDTLPLMPSVMRGPDGLLRIDGARPHEAPLLIDGFDVTDPATGLSSLDLPLETVRRVEVLRDPMAVTLGGALGPMASVETNQGGDAFEAGVQGFVPRPRLSGGGAGRLEGFFPRANVGGSAAAGRLRYFGALEYDFERIPVPGVTGSKGTPDMRETGATLFGRIDLQLSSRHTLGLEGFIFPSSRSRFGLSPLRAPEAAPTVDNADRFIGLVDRHAVGKGMLSLRLGMLTHSFHLRPVGDGLTTIAPRGWAGGSFSALDRYSSRLQASAEWTEAFGSGAGRHELTTLLSFRSEGLQGTVDERPVRILDHAGRTLREITFGAPARVTAHASSVAAALRDQWQINDRLQLDGGVRLDRSSLGGGFVPSARAGFRYAIDRDAITVVKGGAGTFVGAIPLSVPAFGGFPNRLDSSFDAVSGAPISSALLQPAVGALSLPRAFAANLRVERRLAPGWDVSIGAGLRRSSHLATLDVRPSEALLAVRSDGRSRYAEVEAALRHQWGGENQVLVSYIRSSTRGEVNDFATLFAAGDAALLRPGGMARLAADAPHRLLAWGTFDLPRGFTFAPALEWHSGFPYSVLGPRREHRGAPNTAAFPSFFSLDVLVSKTLTVAGRRVRVGAQVFNVTNHRNPRDVFAVAGAPAFGSFTNSVGPTFRGVMGVSW